MTLTAMHRTWALCACVLLFLIQSPDWACWAQGAGFVGVFSVCIATLAIQKDKYTGINLFVVGLAGTLIAYLLIGLVWSGVPYYSLQSIPLYTLLPILLITASLTRDEFIDHKTIYKLLVYVCVALSIGALYQFIVYGDVVRLPFLNPNSLAVMIGIGIVLSFISMLENQSIKDKYIWAIALAIMFGGLIVTESRAGLLFVVITLLTVTAFNLRGGKVRAFQSSIKPMLVSVVLIIAISFCLELSRDTSSTFNAFALTVSTGNSRLAIWQGAIDTALSTHPFIGNGAGNFRAVYAQFRLDGDPSAGLNAHNDLLHLWVELGAIWVMFILGFIVYIATQHLHGAKNPENNHYKSIFIILFMGMMAMVTTIISLPIFMIIFAVAMIDVNPRSATKFNINIPSQIIMFICVVMIGLTVQKTLDSNGMHNIKGAIASGDLPRLIGAADAVDAISMQTNPYVPIVRASSLLALYDKNLLKSKDQKNALMEVDRYIAEAEHRNPYNSEILYYKGELANRKGDADLAQIYWRKTLAIDPRYINARINLAKTTADQVEAYIILRDGLSLKYWKQNPVPLYALILEGAILNKDQATRIKAQNSIQARLRLK